MLFLMQLVDLDLICITKTAQTKDNQTAVNRIASATLLARHLLGIGALILWHLVFRVCRLSLCADDYVFDGGSQCFFFCVAVSGIRKNTNCIHCYVAV